MTFHSPPALAIIGYVWALIAIPVLYAFTHKRPKLAVVLLALCALASLTVGIWTFIAFGPHTHHPRSITKIWIPWALAIAVCWFALNAAESRRRAAVKPAIRAPTYHVGRPQPPYCPPGFELPPDLVRLIEEGRWPWSPPNDPRPWGSRGESEHKIPSSVVEERELNRAVDEHDLGHFLFLEPAPFLTPRQRMELGDFFWQWSCAAPAEIDLDRALVIGQLGIGSDAPIILDYADPSRPPTVKYLRWRGEGTETTKNHWIECSATFRGFALWIGLIAEGRPTEKD